MENNNVILSSFPSVFDILKRYSFDRFRQDAFAALVMAVINLPLGISLAVACGVNPKAGLFSVVVGGFFASLFGGTRFILSGPTAIFLLAIAGITNQFGMDGVYVAGLMAGFFLIIGGIVRFHRFIDFVPYSVVLGFTAGLSVIMFTTQLKDCLGFVISVDPADNPANQIIKHWGYYITHLHKVHWPTLLVSLMTAVPLIISKRVLNKRIPFLVLILASVSLISHFLGLDVMTLSKKFGTIDFTLPSFRVPVVSLSQVIALIPYAMTLAFLGGINSLLTVITTYEMTSKPYNSRIELLGQGAANILVSLFGGLPVSATMARTMTSIQAQAQTPLTGMMQAVFVLIFALNSEKLMNFIPIPCLATIFVVVAYDMGYWKRFFKYCRMPTNESLVLLVTFVLSLFSTIAVAILTGIVLAALLFIRRMSEYSYITPEIRQIPGEDNELPQEISIYHIDGPFFFGASSRLKAILDENRPQKKIAILDFDNVPFIDSTGLKILNEFIKDSNKRGIELILTNIDHARELFTSLSLGVDPSKRYLTTPTLADALQLAKERLKTQT